MSDETYVIKAHEIDDLPTQRKTHFLNENAQSVSRSLSEATGLIGFGFHIMEVQPGHASTEKHVHFNEDECVYVLSGAGIATTGEMITPIGAGDFLGYRRGGLAHKIENTGTEPLRCIVVGNREKTDVVDFPDKAKTMYRSAGLPWKFADHDDLKDRPVPSKL